MSPNILSAAGALRTAGGVLLALLILLVMVTVHEFGHYLAGKALGFKIEEFAVGFGPRLCKAVKKNGEIFSLRAFPLGGFCAFAGEDAEDPDPAAFNNKKPWRRILVLLAGPLMNYLLALVLLAVSFFACGQMLLMAYRVAPPESGLQAACSLQNEDVIIACEGKNIYLTSDLMDALEGRRAGDMVRFTLSRRTDAGRAVVEVPVVLRADAAFENLTDNAAVWRCLGIAEEDGNYLVYAASYRGFGFWETLGRAFSYSARIGGTIFKVLGQLLTGDLGLSAFGGPVTTIRITSEVALRGLQHFLEIAAFIGVNLAVFNLLPIPALDGSKVVFCAIEWVRKKPVNRKAEAIIHAVGFVLLLGFAVLADVWQIL